MKDKKNKKQADPNNKSNIDNTENDNNKTNKDKKSSELHDNTDKKIMNESIEQNIQKKLKKYEEDLVKMKSCNKYFNCITIIIGIVMVLIACLLSNSKTSKYMQ